MISVRCDQCGKDVEVNDDCTGKQVKCTGCGMLVALPAEVIATRVVEATPPPPSSTGETTSIADIPVYPVHRRADAGPDLYSFLAPAQHTDEIGRLGPFRVIKVLGVGGMGVVYKAEDPQLKRPVALKAMLPTVGVSEVSRKRFLREARAAAAITHDHIVPILQVGEDRGIPFMAMQFLEGEPLDERLRRDGRLPVRDVLRIGREIAEGLTAAHEKGLIHRDIKPANIWLEGKKGRVKILDFGLARATEDDTQVSRAGAVLGTPAFMAPEQAAGEEVDQRCDLFSLGVVVYCMCTGQLPFKGKNTLAIMSALAMSDPPSPRALQDDLPQPLSDLVMQLLAKQPEERPVSAEAVVQAIQAMERQEIGGSTSRAIPAPGLVDVGPTIRLDTAEIPSILPPKKRPVWPWLAGALCLGVLAVFLAVRPWDNPQDVLKQPVEQPPPKPVNGSSATGEIVGPAQKYSHPLGMAFVLVGKGTARLGGGGGKPAVKEQTMAYDFYLGKYEVTQEEWERITGTNPSHHKELSAIPKEDLKWFPVENVSWDDTKDFLHNLNAGDPQPGWSYRLPTETEWEYACRGGPTCDKPSSVFHFYVGKPADQLHAGEANFEARRTCKVGFYSPNRLGLFDMHGNVWEWCADALPGDPKDPKAEPLRVARGGSWPNRADSCTAASRFERASIYADNNYGLRVARVPIENK